jgi:arsenite-transporting ATPase
MTAKLSFFIGKGGVGKSTTSALAAMHLAHNGRDTLLVSMDPAHNQRDIFQQFFSEKSKQVLPNLSVKEVALDYWMSTYLKDTEAQLKKAYSYQTAFNLQNYYRILKYSPGLEEYAMLLAFENTVHSEKNRDEIIFDMPPTALTLRFFSLPFITLIWVRELLKLRSQIYEKKEIVSKIRFGKKEIEQDKVKARLESLVDEHLHLGEHFTADQSSVHLVLNNDPLSLAEALRIRRKLEDIGIRIKSVVLNKVNVNESMVDIKSSFDGDEVKRFPNSTKPLYGMDALKNYLLEHADEIKFSSSMPN